MIKAGGPIWGSGNSYLPQADGRVSFVCGRDLLATIGPEAPALGLDKTGLQPLGVFIGHRSQAGAVYRFGLG